MGERRRLCILVSAYPGDVRVARGGVGRAIRKALGIQRWGIPPHHVHYYRSGESPGSTPRFCLDATDGEAAAISKAIGEVFKGWTRPPADIYHD